MAASLFTPARLLPSRISPTQKVNVVERCERNYEAGMVRLDRAKPPACGIERLFS